MSVEQVTIAVLAVTMLVMAGVNVFALIKLMPLIDSEDKGIHDAKALAEENKALIQRVMDRLDALATSPDDQANWADQLEAPLQGISADALEGIDDSMASAEAMLGELDNLQEGDWATWRAANEVQLRNLLRTTESQRRRLASLRMELDQARGTILNLRSATSRQAMGATQAAALQARNTAIETELWSVKAERGRLLSELKLAQKQLQELEARQGAEGESTGGAGDDARVAALESQLAETKSSLANLQALHERTVLEKKFIEDAFIRIDDQLGLGIPMPTLTATATSADVDDDEVQAL